MDVFVQRALLYDFYGAVLSQRQRQAFQMHYLEDLSLAECARELQVSRPAALALVQRAEKALERWERAVGAVAESRRERELWSRVRAATTLEDAVAVAKERLKELEGDV